MTEPRETPFQLFRRTLKVSESLADALVRGQLTSIEEVAYVPFEELSEITGLVASEVTALRSTARLYLDNAEGGDWPI